MILKEIDKMKRENMKKIVGEIKLKRRSNFVISN